MCLQGFLSLLVLLFAVGIQAFSISTSIKEMLLPHTQACEENFCRLFKFKALVIVISVLFNLDNQ